jgi:hypothetical protein
MECATACVALFDVAFSRSHHGRLYQLEEFKVISKLAYLRQFKTEAELRAFYDSIGQKKMLQKTTGNACHQ